MRHLTWPAKTEPSLHEVLSDPIVRLMMTCDNVSDDDLIDLIETHQRNLAVRFWRSTGPCSGETLFHELLRHHRNLRRWKRIRALGLDRVLGGAEEALDAQVLLDPLKEQLDLPAAFVELRDGERR